MILDIKQGLGHKFLRIAISIFDLDKSLVQPKMAKLLFSKISFLAIIKYFLFKNIHMAISHTSTHSTRLVHRSRIWNVNVIKATIKLGKQWA